MWEWLHLRPCGECGGCAWHAAVLLCANESGSDVLGTRVVVQEPQKVIDAIRQDMLLLVILFLVMSIVSLEEMCFQR